MLELRRLLERLLQLVDEQSLTELTSSVLWETGYIQQLRAERTVEAQGRLENLEEFLSVTRQAEMDLTASDEQVSTQDVLLAFWNRWP